MTPDLRSATTFGNPITTVIYNPATNDSFKRLG
jgi:hypothetical protein